MPYYSAGDYYQGGDNYHRAGDFLGIGKALKKFQPLKAIGGLVGRAVGSIPIVGGVAASLLPGISSRIGGPAIIAPRGAPEPGISGIVHRALPGGSTGLGYYNKKGDWIEGKRPRMDVGNTKALKRASRRAHGFLKLTRGLVRYYTPKSPKGKAYIRFKKKSR